jgi:Haem-NO-binding
MYGLVNRAIEQMISGAYGEARWEAIKVAARIDADLDLFVANESYDDAVTYRLVAAASEELALPAAQVLEAFGRYWILHTAKEGYGTLLSSVGKDVGEFLENLPGLHTRVRLIYPHLEPPRFACERTSSHALTLHYRSDRAGLAPFVRGLLLGIGELFATPVAVRQLAAKDAGEDHDIFLVEWAARP